MTASTLVKVIFYIQVHIYLNVPIHTDFQNASVFFILYAFLLGWLSQA